MRNRKIRLLCSDADREALQELLAQLLARGLQISEEAPGKNDLVLAALSGSFYADEGKTAALLDLVAAGAENVLPVQLDSAPIPDAIKNALYARNIIPAAGRDAAHTAERIVDALPKQKSKLPLILSTVGVVLLAVIGLLIWRGAQNGEAVPVMAETVEEIYIPEGLTAEDLEQIVGVIIVGEQMELYTKDEVAESPPPRWDLFAYRDWENDGPHWYSREDGHEYSMTRYEDLRFVELMPNLRLLTLARMEAGQLPELGKLTRLRDLVLMDSDIPDLEWVRGSAITKIELLNSTGSVTDFGPLTSCEELREVHLDLVHTRQADLSGFAPPVMDLLWINNGDDLETPLDLSSIAACTRLNFCQLEQDLPITDLSFLSGATAMETLHLHNLHELRDISALARMPKLRELSMGGLNQLRDYSPIAQCTGLETFDLACDDVFALRDAGFLGNLPSLKNIWLGRVDLPDLSFLVSLSKHTQRLSFGFDGRIGDYSGLAAVRKYSTLSLDPDDNVPLDTILPYLEGAEIQDLQLRRFAEVDLSMLPLPTNRLELDRCGIEDLSTLPEDWKAPVLFLNKCAALRSLDGLQNQSKLGQGSGQIEIYNCPRLTDWSALEGMSLASLFVTGGYTLPEGVSFRTGTLRLDSVADVSDLGFLDSLDAEKPCSFALVGLDDLNNLQSLSRFHGAYLAVSPQLAEQAEDLVKAGNFSEYRIEYPQGGWEEDDMEFALLSLDELDTLPPALLRRVTTVCIAGDRVVDPEQYDLWEDWEHKDRNGNPALQLHDRETGEESPLSPGVITDLEKLSALTGLRELYLYGQPIQSLDGIQALSSLEEFSAKGCSALTDASALFALPELRWVELKCTQVESIQGVQNLPELRYLNVSNTKVDDLTPLAECDFSAAEEDIGFDLDCNELKLGEEDFAAMAHIRRFGGLAFTDADPAVWIPALSDSEIRSFGAANDLRSDEDLAAFAADHPELRDLYLGWAEDITDLTPLLALENLEKVGVRRDMTKAIASLDGQSYGFELEIQG